jgi:hypothetical protein
MVEHNLSLTAWGKSTILHIVPRGITVVINDVKIHFTEKGIKYSTTATSNGT